MAGGGHGLAPCRRRSLKSVSDRGFLSLSPQRQVQRPEGRPEAVGARQLHWKPLEPQDQTVALPAGKGAHPRPRRRPRSLPRRPFALRTSRATKEGARTQMATGLSNVPTRSPIPPIRLGWARALFHWYRSGKRRRRPLNRPKRCCVQRIRRINNAPDAPSSCRKDRRKGLPAVRSKPLNQTKDGGTE